MPKRTIKLYNLVKNSKVLGKGNRFVIWVQGCLQRCHNCFTPDAQPLDGGLNMAVDELAKMILESPQLAGITITGGEPFLQAKALNQLLSQVHSQAPWLDVIVYSGYTFNHLHSLNNESTSTFLNKIDLLIDGNYVDTLNYDTPLVGSSNQRANIMTSKGETLALYMQKQKTREIEFYAEHSGALSIVGIAPKQQDILLQTFEQTLLTTEK